MDFLTIPYSLQNWHLFLGFFYRFGFEKPRLASLDISNPSLMETGKFKLDQARQPERLELLYVLTNFFSLSRIGFSLVKNLNLVRFLGKPPTLLNQSSTVVLLCPMYWFYVLN